MVKVHIYSASLYQRTFMENKMYSIEETAKILNVHAITIRRYIKDGKIVASKIGGKWSIPSSSICGKAAEYSGKI